MADLAPEGKTTEKFETKEVPTEFKAAGDRGEYEGYFSIFTNTDDGDDVSHPGMFAKTIAERGRRVKTLAYHSFDKLIGPAPDELREDQVGLYAKGRLTIKNENSEGAFWANQVWALLKDNALTEGSFGYQAVKFDYENKDGRMIRNLREVKLYEISFVPLGMNPLTQVRALKDALAGDDPLDLLADKALAFETVIRELKEGRMLSAASRAKLQKAIDAMQGALEPLQELMTAAEPEAGKANHTALLLSRLRAAELALAL